MARDKAWQRLMENEIQGMRGMNSGILHFHRVMGKQVKFSGQREGKIEGGSMFNEKNSIYCM